MSHSIGRNLAVLLLISVICLGVSSCGGGVSNGGSAAPSAFLFAADSGEGNPSLDVFTVSSSGSIALASGSPYTVNGPPASLIAASGEDHLLFADGGNLPVSSSLYVFRIGANGVLTSLGSPVLAIGFPSTLSVAPAGDFLFVDGQIFTIDAATGALALLGYAPASGPGMFSPDGRFIFSLDSFSGVESYTFTFDSKTGAATPVSSLGFLPFDTSPRPPVVHPSGKFVYVPYFAERGHRRFRRCRGWKSDQSARIAIRFRNRFRTGSDRPCGSPSLCDRKCGFGQPRDWEFRVRIYHRSKLGCFESNLGSVPLQPRNPPGSSLRPVWPVSLCCAPARGLWGVLRRYGRHADSAGRGTVFLGRQYHLTRGDTAMNARRRICCEDGAATRWHYGPRLDLKCFRDPQGRSRLSQVQRQGDCLFL